MNTFILSYNPFGVKLSAGQLLGWIQESKNLTGWYSPFVGTYYLKSNMPIGILLNGFNAAFDGEHFLLAQVHPSYVGGQQPQQIWNWINTGNVLTPPLPGPF